MKKFLNDPADFVDEMLDGLYRAYPEIVPLSDDKRCLGKSRLSTGTVGIVTGGGSGHLPLFLGYVGEGMLDGAAVGGVFQSPSAEQMYQVTKHVDQGMGVLYIYGNYTGDIMNFDMAAELAQIDGIEVKQVVGNDDVASSVVGEEHKRRGVAGIFFVFKAAGAAAAKRLPLSEVARIADKARARTRTIGVALSSCVVPEVGRPTFSIADDEMEIGMGIHGEPGIGRTKLATADRVVAEMLERIFVELPPKDHPEVAVLVNGLGGTSLEELFVVFRRTAQILEERGVALKHVWVGQFATSMEMAGFSISLIGLDAELEPLIGAPANTPFFKHIVG